jgi:hypothetical protein
LHTVERKEKHLFAAAGGESFTKFVRFRMLKSPDEVITVGGCFCIALAAWTQGDRALYVTNYHPLVEVSSRLLHIKTSLLAKLLSSKTILKKERMSLHYYIIW